MTIKIYQNKSARNVVDKNIGTAIQTFANAQIKDQCSVTDPVIILSNFTGALTGNYMYIQEFGRYYYINNIEIEHQRIIIYAHTDVLMTYQSQILLMNAYIKRNRDKWNLYVPDKHFVVRGDKNIQVLEFKGATSSFQKERDRMSFVLTVAGQQQDEPEPEQEGGV